MISKTLPRPTPDTQAYWDASQKGQFTIQQCQDCSQYQFYPRVLCIHCGGENVNWISASGEGQVESFTIIHRAIMEAYADDVPYIVALIRLKEGPCMMSNIIDCEIDTLAIGMNVKVDFKAWDDSFMVPVFRPLNSN